MSRKEKLKMAKKRLENFLKNNCTDERKILTVSVKQELAEAVEQLAKVFSEVTDGSFTKQKLMEESLEAFVEESKELLKEQYGIEDIFAVDLVENEEIQYDLVVVPAHEDGFEEVFLGENEWRWVRLKREKLEKIKYLALYVGRPISAITHYAKIKEFVYSKDERKYRVLFEGSPVELNKPVPLGKAASASVRAPRYTTLNKLREVSDYSEL